jgi:hypothetical protein
LITAPLLSTIHEKPRMRYKHFVIDFENFKVPYLNSFFFAFATNVLLIGAFFYFQEQIPPVVPLWYGKAIGESQLAPKIYLILPNTFALLVSIINIILTKAVKDSFLHQVFIGLTVTATVLATITVINIVYLVGSI